MHTSDDPSDLASLRLRAEARIPASSRADRRGVDQLVHELRVHQIELELQNECLREMQVELQVALFEQRLAAVAFESQLGMIVTDGDGLIMRVNAAFARLTGFSPEDVIGCRASTLRARRDGNAFGSRMWETLAREGFWQGDMLGRRRSGGHYSAWVTVTAVRGADGAIVNYVGTLSDNSESKLAQAELHRLAYYDPLTHLPNRRLLNDRLARAQVRSRRSGDFGALLEFDLERWRSYHDLHGHRFADLLVGEIARRLHGALTNGELLTRPGEHVFVVLVEALGTEPQLAAQRVGELAARLQGVLAQPVTLAGQTCHGAASVGLVVFRGQQDSSDTLLKHLELATQRARTEGASGLRFYDPGMQTDLEDRIRMEGALREALLAEQFVLHFQPQLDAGGRIIGAEALLRWNRPEQGLVLPGAFIALAEETGLILPLGDWILAQACRRLRLWSEQRATCHLALSVNLSGVQLRAQDLACRVGHLLSEAEVDPARLTLELTESAMLDDLADAAQRMQALKDLGVRLSIDDFGTGNSSLAYLARLPLDELKIDQSFVRCLPGRRNDAVIAQSIVALAAGLGLAVVAEGVETEAQRSFLLAHGCRTFQGHLFSPALPVTEFERALTNPSGT